MICYLFTAPAYFLFSSDVPQLLYYSHIPVAIISILIGLFVFWNGKKLLLNRLLFAIAICFSLWVFSNLILWTNIHSNLMLFVWSFLRIFSSLISILCVYFIYVFLEKKDVPLLLKGIFLLLIVPVIILAPTHVNLGGFNLTSCDAFMFEGGLFQFYRIAFGILAMVWILVLLVRKYFTTETDFKKQILPIGIGIELFLFSFFVVTFLAAYLTDIGILSDSRLEFYGLFGMAIFMSFITFLIVRFNTFKVKVLGTQALLTAQGILVGSLLFIQDINYIRVVISLSLMAFLILAIVVVRGVKKEVAQREKIEKLATELEKSNSALEQANVRLQELDVLKSEFVSLATHQIRAPLSAIKGYLSEVFEGDFGPVTDKLKKPLQIVFQSTENLVHIVGDFLNISRIEQNKMKYELKPLDLKQLVEDLMKELKPNIDRAGLGFSFEAPAGNYEIYADIGKVREVVSNLVDNALKYTKQGSIKITLSSNEATQKVRLAITDTGIGIDPALMPKLFQKFTRAEGANEVNIIGTGLGLYVAKMMIEGQHGRVWAESAGLGKGSQFYVELPIAHIS